MKTILHDQLLKRLQPEDLEYLYQPIFDVGIGKITKAEVLLRVCDGASGYYETETLVSSAERTGCVDMLDKNAFLHACMAQKEFHDHGISELAVNFSPATCHDPLLITAVSRTLGETGANPAGLCVEITESYKLTDEALFCSVVNSLYELGLKVAIDDFGIGYSGLKRMLSVPFHTIKLDKSFIRGMETQPLAPSLVGDMIRFAQTNHLTMVAEGIETAEQARVLTGLGCRYLQGYYFSKPVDKESFFTLLGEWSAGGKGFLSDVS